MALNFPTSPTVGQIYAVDGVSWRWDGTSWQVAAEASTYVPVSIGAQPPASPLVGDLWWNNTTGRMSIYYSDSDSSQWVSANSPSNQILDITSAQVVTALLDSLTAYADIAAASVGGVPVGGLFKIDGATDVTGIRVVASYS